MLATKRSMKRAIFFIVFTCVGLSSQTSFGQDSTNAHIDSLVFLLVNGDDSVSKVEVYQSLSKEYLGIDYKRSIQYSELGLDYAMGEADEVGILQSKYDLAHIYSAYILDYNQSLKLYLESLELAEKLDDTEKLMSINQGISYLYSVQENLELAINYIDKAMIYAEELDYYPNISSINSYKGEMLEEKGDTIAAKECYKKVLDMEIDHNFSKASNVSMLTIAHYYDLMGDIDESMKYYRISLKRFERIHNHRWVSYTHSEMARVYVRIGDLERAEQHALKGLEVAEAFGLRKEIGDNYLILSELYDSLDNEIKAVEYSNAYEALQDSLVPIDTAINMIDAPSESNDTTVQAKEKGMNGFLQAIIIIIPVLILLLFMGRPKKS